MKKVWKVKTNLTQDENKKLMSSMTDEDHDLMMSLDLDISVDVLEDDKITSFMVCNELNLEKIKSVLFKYNVEFEAVDTTDFFVNDEVTIDELSDDYIYEKIGA
jgi:hypothetical protein